jgi:DNA replication protein DnaC
MSKLSELSTQLKLSHIRKTADEAIKKARKSKQDYELFLTELLEGELEQRLENGIARRLREAKFPFKKYLVDFKREKYDAEFAPKFDELETLEFIEKRENIILLGTPGAGKTHYAIGIGIKACMEGKSVLFASVPNLIVELREAMSQNVLTSYRRRFERYDLVILDELGYISFDQSGSEMLFLLLTNRNGKGSVIITTNRHFERWEGVFHDPVLTGAMADRLAHNAHVLDISRDESGRFEETLAWMTNSSSENMATGD